MNERLADLLEAIGLEEHFDQKKYNEFQAAVDKGPRNPVIVEAANTLIEYCNCMTSRSLISRRPLRPDPSQERKLREDLLVFSRAIRAGITEYGSLRRLRSRLASG